MLEIKPRWWIGKDSLGIVHYVTHCYNLEKKCVPPYIIKWIGLLMNEYYNRHNKLASACPLTNLSPVFGPSMKRKIGIREAIT